MYFSSNDTQTTEICTLALHDALPIWALDRRVRARRRAGHRVLGELLDLGFEGGDLVPRLLGDVKPSRRGTRSPPSTPERESTRLNSRHLVNSYVVFFF